MRYVHYGPWATALDVGSNVGLSTFWRRRMAMLGTLVRTRPPSKRMRVMFVLAVLSAMGLPSIDRVSVPATALADEGVKLAPGRIAVEYLPPPSAKEEKILAALEMLTTLEFNEQPLGKIVDHLKSKHAIEVQL